MTRLPDFATMNETDVREIIVRPLLSRLGYEHRTVASISTEQTFRYERAFLGRKNPKKDPPLVGRADYVLQVAGVGRWVVEVKSPTEKLSIDVVEQAHTYAAHPEVGALFFLVCNGKSFRLYRTGVLDAPLMAWEWADLEEMFLPLFNLVGPDALRRKMALLQPDTGKPLAPGLPSSVTIIGGLVTYEDHTGKYPLLVEKRINGLSVSVTGGCVRRAEDGRLHAVVKTAKVMTMILDQGPEPDHSYDFYSTDEYISTDINQPTILTNFVEQHTPAGTIAYIPGLGEFPAPFDISFAATTKAVGCFVGEKFVGSMSLSYEFIYSRMPAMIRMGIEAQYGRFPEQLLAEGGGTFEVEILRT